MICITGASGTLGREIVELLGAAKIPFRAAYTSPEGAARAQARGIDTVVADYRRPDTLRAAFDGCARVFLLGPNALDQTRLELAAVEAAVASGVRILVKQSVMGAERDYSLADVHRPVERAIEASGLAWTFLRPNSFMQNVATFMSGTIRSESAMYSATAGARISHVDVRDIAAVAVAALVESGHAGKIYTLTGPQALTYDEMAIELSSVLGRTIHHVDLAPDDLRQAMLAEGMPVPLVDRMLDLERFFREDNASGISDDIERVTGRAPRRFAAYARDCAPALCTE